MKRTLFGFTAAALLAGSASADVFINEIHYDNLSSDTGEFIEIVTTAGEDASLIVVSLYNGSDSELYGNGSDTFVVGTDFVDHGILSDGNRYYSLSLPSNGLQNGSPDGIAVTLNGVVQEFLSYEGVIASAGDGPAAGLSSTDIGATQDFNDGTLFEGTAGASIERIDFGSTWVSNDSNTQGAVNIPEPGSLALLGLGGLLIARRRRG